MSLTIFRVELRDNPRKGAYHPRGFARSLPCHRPMSRPNPWEEGHYMVHDDHCAFRSLEQFYEWFDYPTLDEVRNALAYTRSHLVRYHVTQAIVLEHQVVFKRKHIFHTDFIRL